MKSELESIYIHRGHFESIYSTFYTDIVYNATATRAVIPSPVILIGIQYLVLTCRDVNLEFLLMFTRHPGRKLRTYIGILRLELHEGSVWPPDVKSTS